MCSTAALSSWVTEGVFKGKKQLQEAEFTEDPLARSEHRSMGIWHKDVLVTVCINVKAVLSSNVWLMLCDKKGALNKDC